MRANEPVRWTMAGNSNGTRKGRCFLLKYTDSQVNNARNKYPRLWWIKWSVRICMNRRRQEGPIMRMSQSGFWPVRTLYILNKAAANSIRTRESTKDP